MFALLLNRKAKNGSTLYARNFIKKNWRAFINT